MAIITISRELAALGDETAHSLAAKLNYRLVDKRELEERIKSFGVEDNKFRKFDEKKPSFWMSLSQDRDDYIHFLTSAILAEAGNDNAVLIGRGAAIILKNVPGVFSVFLAAPLEIRIERVKSYFHCDEKRARQILEQSDHDREGFYRAFFDVKWKEESHYHLTLNTGRLHPEICADIVKYMLDSTLTSELEAKSVQKIKELTLGQKIKHGVIYGKCIPVHFFEAVVSGNKVSLYGIANTQALIEAAVFAASELAPDYSMEAEIQVVHDYSIMP